MKALFVLILLFSCVSFSKELTWPEIEKELIGANPDIQKDEFNLKAAQYLAKTGISPFLPEVSVVGGVGQKDTVDSPERGAQGYLRGRWNLFRGFKDSSNRYRLKVQEHLSRLNLDISKKRQLMAAKELYVSLLMLKAQYELFQTELSVNKQQKSMASRKVSAGLTSSVDTLEFELRENTIMVKSRRNQAEAEKRLVELKALLSIAESEKLVVVGDLVSPTKDLPTFEAQSATLLQKSNLEFEIAEAEIQEVKGGYLPEINLEAQFGRITLQDATAARNNENNYLLSVSIPLFSGWETFQRSKAQSQRLLAAQKEIQLQQLELDKNVSSLKLEWNEAWGLLNLNQEALQRIKKYYELTLSEYKRGIKNSPDLVSATERFFDKQAENLQLIKELSLLEAQFQNLY